MRLVDYSEGEYITFLFTPTETSSTATSADKPPRSDYCQPSILRAPEVTLKYPWTSAIDVWTVGCLVRFGASIALLILKVSQLFELLSERQLFDQATENYSKELHLQYIVECLGQFPLEFLQACEDGKKYFDKEGEHTPPITMTIS